MGQPDRLSSVLYARTYRKGLRYTRSCRHKARAVLFPFLGRAGVPFREAGRSAGIRTDDETHGAGHEPVGLKLEDRLYMVSGASIFSRCSALPRTVRAAAHRASRA